MIESAAYKRNHPIAQARSANEFVINAFMTGINDSSPGWLLLNLINYISSSIIKLFIVEGIFLLG